MYSIRKITDKEMSAYLSSRLPFLKEIPKLPQELFIRGEIPAQARTAEEAKQGKGYIYMTVVGSRKYSQYGKDACEMLIAGLRGLPVVIVSGLALGIDSIAHRAAMEAGLKTIAIPGSGIDDATIYPASHLNLAREILDRGGGLLSLFPENARAQVWMFPVRNHIMAGISHATFVIEADNKSGTLITSKYATDFNRDVFALPGSIFSPKSAGANMLIHSGAVSIGNTAQLRDALGFPDEEKSGEKSGGENEKHTADLFANTKEMPKDMSDTERKVFEVLTETKTADMLMSELNVPVHEIQIALSSLEMKRCIREINGSYVIDTNRDR